MVPAPVPSKWDSISDVVIIGGGTGGLPAGITVTESKQKAVILESRPQCGGSLGMVVGAFAIAGSDEQKAQGIKDTPDIYYDDLVTGNILQPLKISVVKKNGFIDYMKSQTATIDVVSLQNEPDWKASYEGCEYSASQLFNFVKNYAGTIKGAKVLAPNP